MISTDRLPAEQTDLERWMAAEIMRDQIHAQRIALALFTRLEHLEKRLSYRGRAGRIAAHQVMAAHIYLRKREQFWQASMAPGAPDPL